MPPPAEATLERTGSLPAELDPLEPAAVPAVLEPGAEADLQELALHAMLGNGAVVQAAALVSQVEAEAPAPVEAEGLPDQQAPPSPLETALRAVLASLLGEAAGDLAVISDAAHDEQLAESGAPAAVSDGALVFPTGQTMPTTPGAGRALLAAVRQALAGVDGPVDPSAPVPPPGFEEFVPVEEAPEGALGEEAPAVEEEPVAAAADGSAVKEVVPPAAEGEPAAPEAGGAPGAAAEAPVPVAPAAERPGFELLMPPAPSAPGAAQVERTERAKRAAGGASRKAARLPSAKETAGEARNAVEEPKEEIDANARAELATLLGENPPPNPAIVKLCDDIRTAIRDRRPVDEEDLTKADPQGVAEEVGNSLNTKIDSDVKGVQKGYEELEDPPAGTAQKDVEPLGAPPPPLGEPEIGAAGAAPDPIADEDLSLEADQAQVAQRVEESGINRPTTEPITDPPFSTVREGQAELAELAKQTPAELAALQQQAIADAQGSMNELQSQAVAILRTSRAGTVRSVGGGQKKMVGTEEQKRAALSKKALGVFTLARDEVNAIVTPLPGRAMTLWKARVDAASGQFKAKLAEVQSWIDERHSGVGGFFLGIADDWTGFPGWVTRAYNDAEKQFGDDICLALQDISRDVDTTIAAAQARIKKAREDIDDVFKDLDPSLEKWAETERAKFHGQLDALSKKTLETRDTFVQDMSRRAITAVTEVQEEVEKRREEAKGRIGRIADAIQEFIDDPVRSIINGLLRLVGIAPKAFWDLVEKIKQAISDIADDPVGFLNNLVEGLKQGFGGFFDRFPTHLLQGFWDWLFSALGSVGVKLPADTSIGSIVTFCLQVMGITWPRIREILAKHIGQENVELIERAWELVSTLIEQGPEGIYAMIKERLDPKRIVDEILDAAIDFMVEAIVKQVAARLLLLFNPAGAVLQAVELIYKLGKWIFQNAARIFRLVETVVNGIVDIIAGNVGGFAKAVEKALASLLPPVIDFIAEYFGLGDLPLKVAEVIGKLQEFVLKIIDDLVGLLVEKAKELLVALGLRDEEEEEEGEGAADEELGRDVGFSAAGEQHHQWIELSGEQAVPMVASAEVTVTDKLAAWDAAANDKFPTADALKQAKDDLDAALLALDKVVTEANALADAYAKHEPGKPLPDDSAVEAAQGDLSAKLAALMNLFEGKLDPELVFAAQLERVHPQARTVIIAALKALKQLAAKWEDVQKEAQEQGALANLYSRPYLKGTEFGELAHIWGTLATEAGVNRALAKYPITSTDKPHARRVHGVRQDLWKRKLLEGEVLDATGAEAYLIGYKPSIHDGKDPFGAAIATTRKAIWDANDAEVSESQLADAFYERALQGEGPSAPDLPDDVRRVIIEKLKGAALLMRYAGEAVFVEVDPDVSGDIKKYLSVESEKNTYAPEYKEMLKWWENTLFQKEFHHAWPEWLGGPSNQTKIHLPRALHNFDTLAGTGFAGGFHQIFNGLFRVAFAKQIDEDKVRVNHADMWKAWVAGHPEALVTVGALLLQSYTIVFAPFKDENDNARDAFVNELKARLPTGAV